MRIFLLIMFFLVISIPGMAQDSKIDIYVSVLETKAYVVGRANAQTGFFHFEGDTNWTHYGWKNIRNFGVSIDRSNKDYIFLASGNGALRSLDGGKSWRITTGWQVTEVLDIAVLPSDPDLVFIASAYGVWRTEDRGESWIPASEGLNRKFVQTIEADRNSASRLLTGGTSGMYQWSGSQKKWERINVGDFHFLDIFQCSSDLDLWIAGAEENGIFISKDNGRTWIRSEGQTAKESIYAVAVDPLNNLNMAAGGFQTGVFFSRDGGSTWNQKNEEQPAPSIHALQFDPVKPGRLWAGTLNYGVFYSDDYGANWNYAGLNGSSVWDMIIIKGK